MVERGSLNKTFADDDKRVVKPSQMKFDAFNTASSLTPCQPQGQLQGRFIFGLVIIVHLRV